MIASPNLVNELPERLLIFTSEYGTVEEFIGNNVNSGRFFNSSEVYDKYIRLLNLQKRHGNWFVDGIETFDAKILFGRSLKIHDPNFRRSDSGLYIFSLHDFGYVIESSNPRKRNPLSPNERPYVLLIRSANPFEKGIYKKYYQDQRKNRREFQTNLNRIDNLRGLRNRINSGRFMSIEQLNQHSQLLQRIPKIMLFKEWCENGMN